MNRFIQSQSQHYPVQVLCQTLGVNRSRYYDWRKPTTKAPAKETDNRNIKFNNTQQIEDIFNLHLLRYSSRRLVSEMKGRKINVSRDFVRKVLIKNQIKPIQPHSFSFLLRATDSLYTIGYSPNLLLDRPSPTGTNQVWVSAITYLLLTKGKWLYLAVWVDLCRAAGAVKAYCAWRTTCAMS